MQEGGRLKTVHEFLDIKVVILPKESEIVKIRRGFRGLGKKGGSVWNVTKGNRMKGRLRPDCGSQKA